MAQGIVLSAPQLRTLTTYSEDHDSTTLEEIGLNFPLLDRDCELQQVLKGLEASFDTSGVEPHRNVPIYCIGGVSGSGKTRFAEEIAPHFNQLNKPQQRALFCKIICAGDQDDLTTIYNDMLHDLLKRSGHNDKYITIVKSSEWIRGSLKYILDLSDSEGYTTAVVVNIDEAQRISQGHLQSIIKKLTKAISTSRTAYFWPLATGLDLRHFVEARRLSDQPLKVKTLQPVRNLDRALLHTLGIKSASIHCERPFKALMVSLDGVPRLLWAAIAAFADVTYHTQDNLSVGFGTIRIDFKTVYKFLHTADDKTYKAIYSQILGLIHGNLSYFLSLSSMVQWSHYTDVLSCIVAGCPVKLEDQLGPIDGKLSISTIAARGWALLLPFRETSDCYVLTLPLLYLHSFDLNTWQATSVMKNAVDVLRTPSRGLSEDDAEKLDINILDFRARAYRALGKDSISLSELLGGVAIPKDFKFNVSLHLGGVSGKLLDTADVTIVSDFLNGSTDESVCSFTSKNKASYADSGIIFRGCTPSATESIIVPRLVSTRSATVDEYNPSHPKAFSVLVQSKRYLSMSSKITQELALEEFAKVKNTLRVSRVAFVMVSDKKECEALTNQTLRKYCIIITGEELELFMGPMLYPRRRAAANVTRTKLKNPDFESELSHQGMQTISEVLVPICVAKVRVTVVVHVIIVA